MLGCLLCMREMSTYDRKKMMMDMMLVKDFTTSTRILQYVKKRPNCLKKRDA